MASVNVTVFDSSTIDFPSANRGRKTDTNNPPITWGRKPNQNKSVGWADRPSSRGSTRGGPTPDLEAHRTTPVNLSSGAMTFTSPVPSRRWAEQSNDKRSRAIINTLESRRATRQSENTDTSNPSVQYYSPRTQESQDEITKEKVITYPKFVVVHDNKPAQNSKIDGKTLGGGKNKDSDIVQQARANKHSKNKDRHNIEYDTAQLRRDVNARRSFKAYRSSKVSVYDQSSFSMFGRSNSQDKTTKSMENLNRQDLDNELIAGFFPEEMQEYLQARAFGSPTSMRSASKQGRMDSPMYVHQPPPPTPASALLMSFGIDPNDKDILEEELKNEIRLENEYRMNVREKMRSREKYVTDMKLDGSDPGVSHTTHRLLQSQLIKQTFAFPDISPEMQRKAPGRTPRVDESLYNTGNHGNTGLLHKMVRTNNDLLLTSQEKLPHLEDNIEKMDIRHSPRPAVSQEILPGSSKEQPQMKRAKTSIGSELVRSQTFVQNRDKYSKLVSMGLPKVNLDIDRNHFSSNNLMRKSLSLREKFDIKDVNPDSFDQLRKSMDTPQLMSAAAVSQSEDNHNSKNPPKPLLTHLTLAINMQTDRQNTGVRKSKIKTHSDNPPVESNQVPVPPTTASNTEGADQNQIKFQPPPNTPTSGEMSNGGVKPSKTHRKSKDKRVRTKVAAAIGVTHVQTTRKYEQNGEQHPKVSVDHPFELRVENGKIFL